MSPRDRLDCLLQTAFTTTALEQQHQLWRECLEYALYHTTAADPAEVASQHGAALATTADRAVVTSWSRTIWEGVHTDNFTAVYEAMVTEIATLSVMVLYIPAMLTDDDVSELGTWCRAECGAQLLELKVDPAVVGGVGFIDQQQRYQEISLRSELASRSDIITQIIARYV